MDKEGYIVYGAGRVGKEIVDLLLKIGKEVVMLWDRNSKKEGTYQGIPIVNPYENIQVLQEGKKYKIIIGLANALENEKIYHDLHRKGYEQVYQYYWGGVM